MGATTTNALDSLEEIKGGYTQEAHGNARTKNGKSLSNGSLMRCTPMAVWASGLQDMKQFKEAIYNEVQFTHSNVVTLNANLIYSLAIKHLLNNPTEKDRGKKAFEICK
jgi:ADP-ribosylglycohydrolase